MYFTKDQLIKTLKAQLGTRTVQARKALLTIYAYQTNEEMESSATVEDNGVGFTGCDAEFLSSLALQLMKYNHLSEKQDKVLLKMMPKYASQLIKHSIDSGKIRCEGRGKYTW